jgi:hypothetical protein
MSPESRCSFCRQLPATAKKRGGKPGKCPVCKGALLVTADASFRLVSAEEMPDGTAARSWKPIALLAMAICLVLTVWLGKHFLVGGPEVTKETSAAAIPAIPARISSPVEATFSMAAVPVRQISQPRNAETGAGREPTATARIAAQTMVATKAIPKNLAAFPVAKTKKASVQVVMAKTTPAPSYVKLFMKQSRYSYYHVKTGTLADVPEIDLDEPPSPYLPTAFRDQKPKAKIAKKIEEILELTKKDGDAFVKQIKLREDLHGLPFVMGEQCRLSKKEASALRNSSLTIRRSLDFDKQMGTPFWRNAKPINMANLPAMEQILLAENNSHRKMFVQKLEDVDGPRATRILAQRAIFDLDDSIRKAALEMLKTRPQKEITPVLLQGLRYPWPQVVSNSAEALVMLKRTDLAPTLVEMLDMPNPGAPFMGGPKNNELVVRELVRINHHRNCLLCHAPADQKTLEREEAPLGPIPTPGERMPTSATIYYSLRSDDNGVRADVTYLRQDFSLMLPVAYAHPWPALQRYDFVVRVRPLRDQEALILMDGIPTKETEHKNTIVQALQDLTGLQYAGHSAAVWRRLLDARPDRVDRAWRSLCNK